MTIRIHVPAVPVAQPRQRHRLMKVGNKTFSQNYTPRKHPVRAFKARVRLAAKEAGEIAVLTGPLRVDVTFIMPRPGRLVWKTRPMPRVPHTSTPDRDNLDKAVMDALSGLLWNDDAQVCQGTVEKWIAAGDEEPHVEIVVSELVEKAGGGWEVREL